jgi:acyl-CoA thioester hydrolase
MVTTPIDMPPGDMPYVGRLEAGAHRYAVRVYYEDTDAGGVVYHANYLRFFERARSDMLGLAGVDHVAAAAAGEGHYVVAEAVLRYVGSARLGDALVIVSRVEAVRRAACVIQQRVMRDRQLLVEGRLTVAFVGQYGRPRRQPPQWIQAFEAIKGADTEA